MPLILPGNSLMLLACSGDFEFTWRLVASHGKLTSVTESWSVVMQVEISGDQTKLINELIASGRFSSAEQVIEEALLSLTTQQREYNETVANIETSLADERAGQVNSISDIADRLRRELNIARPSS